MEFFGAVAAFGAVFLGVWAYGRYEAKQRRAAMEREAAKYGFDFSPDPRMPSAGAIAMFERGHSHEALNMWQGAVDGVEIRCFDHHYTVGSGKNASSYATSVALFELSAQRLPEFTCSPEQFYHKIGSVFGYQDIDFSDSPKFSGSYLLRGKPAEGVRALFHLGVRGKLANERGWTIEGGGRRVAICRHGAREAPAKVYAFIIRTKAIYDAFDF